MKKWSLALLLPVVLWSTSASAAVVEYSSEAAWMTAVGSFVTEPFNNAGLQPSTGVFSSVGHIEAGQWHDRVTVSGGESTTFFYTLHSPRGASRTRETAPPPQGQAPVITRDTSRGGIRVVAQMRHI